ncbi:MAG: hypothetical protein IKV43_01295 [Clostridia bacterium]|nr:hypothetical protein [Clostridia bacterium]
MKAINLIAIIGNILMFIGCVFLIINLTVRDIFPGYVTLPLVLAGVVGNVATLVQSFWKK